MDNLCLLTNSLDDDDSKIADSRYGVSTTLELHHQFRKLYKNAETWGRSPTKVDGSWGRWEVGLAPALSSSFPAIVREPP